MQAGVPSIVHNVDVCLAIQQQLDKVLFRLGARVLERRMALPVLVVDRRTVVQQVLHNLNVSAENGKDQRSGLGVVLQVDESVQVAGLDQMLAQVLEQAVSTTQHCPVEQGTEVLRKGESASHC